MGQAFDPVYVALNAHPDFHGRLMPRTLLKGTPCMRAIYQLPNDEVKKLGIAAHFQVDGEGAT